MLFNYSYGKPKMTPKYKVETNENKPVSTWIRKIDYKACVFYISLRTYTVDFWYFDSGRFGHTTGDRSALINYQKVDWQNVTFANGVKSHALGKGTLNMEGFPKLDNVLHVEDL